MSGYREHSFDPNAVSADRGPPMRPFNWVQWCGVAVICIAVMLDLDYLAGQFGWLPKWTGSVALAAPLPIWGMILINSRRQSLVDPAPELAAARKRWLIITVGVCAFILGIAAVFALKGY